MKFMKSIKPIIWFCEIMDILVIYGYIMCLFRRVYPVNMHLCVYGMEGGGWLGDIRYIVKESSSI